jgi:hypothetical protein
MQIKICFTNFGIGLRRVYQDTGPRTQAQIISWAVKDPMMQQIQMRMFLKNISMLGSALFFAQIGTGPLSRDSCGGPVR